MREFKPHRKTQPRVATGLVLSRKVGESIWVGDDVRVTVTQIQGDVVRLCFDAPTDVEIDREEIRKAKGDR